MCCLKSFLVPNIFPQATHSYALCSFMKHRRASFECEYSHFILLSKYLRQVSQLPNPHVNFSHDNITVSWCITLCHMHRIQCLLPESRPQSHHLPLVQQSYQLQPWLQPHLICTTPLKQFDEDEDDLGTLGPKPHSCARRSHVPSSSTLS